MKIGYITGYGNVRTENQDRFLALLRWKDGVMLSLCAVADGMGGTQDGGLASELTVNRLKSWWEEELPQLLTGDAVQGMVSQSLDLVIQECHRIVWSRACERGVSSGTTLSLLFFYGGQILVKHIGDSRIYYERNGQWAQLTQDHTWEQQELERGADPTMDPGYLRKKGALVNALGACESCRIDTRILQMAEGDRYLVCSDGFYRYLDPGSRMREDGDPQKLLEEKEREILLTPATDNYTAILAVNDGQRAGKGAVNTLRLQDFI